MDLSVIIVSYDSRFFLELCLRSLKASLNKIKSEIIVVDNNSDDNKLDSFKNKYKWVKWIENSKNFGFAKACNIGANYCKSKWYLFLNPDTILVENSLESLIFYCNNNIQYKIIGTILGDFIEFRAIDKPKQKAKVPSKENKAPNMDIPNMENLKEMAQSYMSKMSPEQIKELGNTVSNMGEEERNKILKNFSQQFFKNNQ